MKGLREVVFTSDESGQWNTCVWDPRTSTMLMSYKGGNAAAPHTLSLIKNNFIIAADQLKPLLHVWPINSQEPLQGVRLVCPAKVQALDISPSGLFCAAGVGEKLHIWHLSTGRLFAVVSHHYQPISCVKFNDRGTHVITAAQDGIILVWNLAYIINPKPTKEIMKDPLYTFSDHTLPVSDIFLGKGGLNTRLISVSSDRTCRIYDLSHGKLLNTVIFKSALSSVTMDAMEQSVYVGDVEGIIYQFYLCSAPTVVEADSDMRFLGHNGVVSRLSVSGDGLTLMSGSKDGKIIFWHVLSRKMIRTIPLKGPVTNAFYGLAPSNMFKSDFKPPALSSLAKTIAAPGETFTIEILNTNRSKFNSDNILSEVGEKFSAKSSEDKATIKKLEKINRELYTTAVAKILNKN